MEFVKKEWKAILLIFCLVLIVVFLSQINSQLRTINNQNAKLISTIDTIESIGLSTNSGVNDMGKKIDGIDGNLSFVVQKMRRR